MTDQEFEVLDELYFVISFHDLIRNLSWKAEELLPVLVQLYERGMVKCIDPLRDEEIELTPIELEQMYPKLLFLATKKGLMEHNSRVE